MIDTGPHAFARQLLFMLSGPLIWFVHFSLIYGAAGFGGAFGFSPVGIRLLAWGVTLAASVALIAMLWQLRGSRALRPRDSQNAIHEFARALAALSLVAILFEALVLWVVPL